MLRFFGCLGSLAFLMIGKEGEGRSWDCGWKNYGWLFSTFPPLSGDASPSVWRLIPYTRGIFFLFGFDSCPVISLRLFF